MTQVGFTTHPKHQVEYLPNVWFPIIKPNPNMIAVKTMPKIKIRSNADDDGNWPRFTASPPLLIISAA